MKFKLLKILLLLALVLAITCCFTIDIFGSRSGATVFFAATGLIVIIPVIMAIMRPKQNAGYLALLLPVFICALCFSSDFLQQTLFVNQRTSTYHFQQERKAFIRQNEHYIISEVKRIEALLAADSLNANLETAFINTHGNSNPPKDTIVTFAYKGTGTTLTVRQVSMDFNTRSFNFRQTEAYVLNGFTVKNGRIIQLSFDHPAFKASPYFYNYSIYFYPYGNVDPSCFTSEIVDFGSHYYLAYCHTRHYLFEGKWIFQVEGKCLDNL